MIGTKALIAALALMLPFAPVVAAATTVAASSPAIRVMPLGDSITWGAGSPSTSSYRAPLWTMLAGQSRYSARFVGSQASGSLPDPANEGHSGYTIDQIIAGVDGWVSFARPDVVLLHIGINDLDRGIDVPGAPGRLHTLVDKIFTDKPGVAVLVLGLIPTTPGLETQTTAFNNAVSAMQAGEQQAGHHFRYVTPPALTSAQMNDDLHPNDAGYLRMAQALDPALDQAFTDGWLPGHPQRGAGTEAGTGKVRWADFDGDGRADYLTVASSGAVSVYLNRGGDGHGGWEVLGQVATGTTTDPTRARFADFDGDGRADYLTIASSGAVSVQLNHGGDGHGGWEVLGQVATGTTTDPAGVRFADLDGDARADYVTIAATGALTTYLNRGGDGHGSWLPYGQVATGLTTDASRVALADATGGGNADYLITDPVSNAATCYSWQGGDGHGGWLNLGSIASGVPIG
jgi:lysophospholipase L1-like esterase